MTVTPNPIAEINPDTAYYPIPKVRTDYTFPISAIKSLTTLLSAQSVISIGTFYLGSHGDLNLMKDGDFAVGAFTANKNLSDTGYFEFDFGSISVVGDVHWKWLEDNNGVSKGWRIQYSTDKVAWTTIDDETTDSPNAGNTVTHEKTTTINASMRYIKFIFDGDSGGTKYVKIFEITTTSNSAPSTFDGNLATSDQVTGINSFFQQEMSALIDKKPVGFYIYLKNAITATKLKIELSTDAITWDEYLVLNIGSDVIINQDNYIEVNRPVKNYRYYRLISNNLDSQTLDLAEMRFLDVTDFEERHGHKLIHEIVSG